MCVVSRVYDDFYDKWHTPKVEPWLPVYPGITAKPSQADIEEFLGLVQRAKEQDKRDGNADCGSEEKKRRIQELADELGIEIEFVDD